MIKQILTSAFIILSLSLIGQNESKRQFSIELDPAPYAYHQLRDLSNAISSNFRKSYKTDY